MRRLKNAISEFVHNLKYRLERARKGYAISDTWNIDQWFIAIMPNMLTDFLKYHSGYPCDMTSEEWSQKIIQMRDLALMMDEERVVESLGYDGQDYKKVHEALERNKEEFFSLFKEYFFALWY